MKENRTSTKSRWTRPEAGYQRVRAHGVGDRVHLPPLGPYEKAGTGARLQVSVRDQLVVGACDGVPAHLALVGQLAHRMHALARRQPARLDLRDDTIEDAVHERRALGAVRRSCQRFPVERD